MEESFEIMKKAVRTQLNIYGHFGAAKRCDMITEALTSTSASGPTYVLYHDEPDFFGMTYTFIITCLASKQIWQISSIKTIFAVYNHPSQAIIFKVEKYYDTISGLLPRRNRLQHEMIKFVRIEQARCILKLNPEIDAQLVDLGFDTTQLQTNFEKDQVSAIALISSEIISVGKIRELGHIGYYFNLQLIKGQTYAVDHVIVAIYASFENSEEIDFGPIAVREYISSAGPLPDRRTIVSELRVLFEDFFKEVDETRRNIAQEYPTLPYHKRQAGIKRARASPE